MQFQEAHSKFVKEHLERRSGERRGRLERGHAHAEVLFLRNVWWPLRGHFDHLHPEYEVIDWRGRSYFADFLWRKNDVKLLIEIKGYASHVRELDRQKFCNELNRETFLTAMGYQIISFPYDNVEQQPELCITMLRMVMSKYQPQPKPIDRSLLAEKEILRLALQLARPIRPIEIEKHFAIDHRTVVGMLQRLCSQGHLRPCRSLNTKRVLRYELAGDVLRML